MNSKKYYWTPLNKIDPMARGTLHEIHRAIIRTRELKWTHIISNEHRRTATNSDEQWQTVTNSTKYYWTPLNKVDPMARETLCDIHGAITNFREHNWTHIISDEQRRPLQSLYLDSYLNTCTHHERVHLPSQTRLPFSVLIRWSSQTRQFLIPHV